MRLLTGLIWTGLIIQNQYDYGACMPVSVATCANYQLRENKYDGMEIAKKTNRINGVWVDNALDLSKYGYFISLSKPFKLSKEGVIAKLASGVLMGYGPFKFSMDGTYEMGNGHAMCIVNYSKKGLIVAGTFGTGGGENGYLTVKWKDLKYMHFSTIHQ